MPYDQIAALSQRLQKTVWMWWARIELKQYRDSAPAEYLRASNMTSLLWQHAVRVHGVDAASVAFGFTKAPWVSRAHGDLTRHARYLEA